MLKISAEKRLIPKNEKMIIWKTKKNRSKSAPRSSLSTERDNLGVVDMFTSLGESWDLTSLKPRIRKIKSGNTGSRHGKLKKRLRVTGIKCC